MTSEEAKNYLFKHDVPHIFECLMTALMYHRPANPVTFLQECLQKIDERGVEAVKWDLFLDRKRNSPLPPISREGSAKTHTEEENGEEAQNHASPRRSPLPPIGAVRIEDLASTLHLSKLDVNIPVVFVAGTPLSRAGSVAKRLVEQHPKWYATSLVELLLRFVASHKPEVEKAVREVLTSGKHLPDELVVFTLLECVETAQHGGVNGIIIEGFPQSQAQLQLWERHTDGRVDHVFLIDAQESAVRAEMTLFSRVAQLLGDHSDAIEARLKHYKEHTLPAFKYLDDKKLLTVIDGDMSEEAIHRGLLEGLHAKFKRAASASRPEQPPETHQAHAPQETEIELDGDAVEPDDMAGEEDEPAEHHADAEPQREEASDDAAEPEVHIESAAHAVEPHAEPHHQHAAESELPSGRQPGLPSCPIVIVLGGPGTNKNELCNGVCHVFSNVQHLNVNHLLRENGLDPAELTVADDMVTHYVVQALSQYPAETTLVLLDGFPRNAQQLAHYHQHIGRVDKAVVLEASREAMEEAIANRFEQLGEQIDSPEQAARRIEEFLHNTSAVLQQIEHLSAHMLFKLDGSSEIASLVDSLAKHLESSFHSIKFDPLDKAAAADAAADDAETKKDAVAESNDTNSMPLKNAAVIFVLGGPGSGKGTQCERIVEKYGYKHLSSGDLLRAEVQSGSERGQELKAIMEAGQLVTLDVVLGLLRDAMLKDASTAKGFLIDGFPREMEQAIRFETEVAECRSCIYFEVSDEVMKGRLLKRGETSGRVDDNEETIAKRLKTFHDQTEPVARHFSQKGKLRRICAEASIDDVFGRVQQVFDNIEHPDEPSLSAAKVVFVLGGPGSGKGTQCERLLENYKDVFAHLSSGDLLRAEVQSGSERGNQLKEIMEAGQLVSLDVVLALLQDGLRAKLKEGKCFLVDGFPREVEQARRFEGEIVPGVCCLYFEVSDDVMKSRLMKRGETSGRVDDNEETIAKRLQTFHDATEPVVQYFNDRVKLRRINAERGIDDIYQDVVSNLTEMGVLSH